MKRPATRSRVDADRPCLRVKERQSDCSNARGGQRLRALRRTGRSAADGVFMDKSPLAWEASGPSLGSCLVLPAKQVVRSPVPRPVVNDSIRVGDDGRRGHHDGRGLHTGRGRCYHDRDGLDVKRRWTHHDRRGSGDHDGGWLDVHGCGLNIDGRRADHRGDWVIRSRAPRSRFKGLGQHRGGHHSGQNLACGRPFAVACARLWQARAGYCQRHQGYHRRFHVVAFGCDCFCRIGLGGLSFIQPCGMNAVVTKPAFLATGADGGLSGPGAANPDGT